MKNSPSTTPSSSSHEAPKGLNFRLAIAFILALGASIGIGKCVYDKKDAGHPGKPKLTDIMKQDAEAEKQELSLKQCQMDLLLGIAGKQCEQLSEEEIKRRYLEREKSRLEKRAADIIEKLGITKTDDQEKIFRAVVAGCSEYKYSVDKNIVLKEPPRPNSCFNLINLEQDVGANFTDSLYSDDSEDIASYEK